MTLKIGNQTQQAVTLPGQINKVGQFTVAYQSSYPTQNALFGSQKVICGQGECRLGFAAEPNGPVTGGIGDMQSNTLEGLTNCQFSFPFETISVNYGNSGAKATYPPVGLATFWNYPTFPLTLGGIQFSSAGSMLIGNYIGGTNTAITVTFPANYTLSIVKSEVCPDVTFLGLQGCYSCAIGSQLCFKGRSTCAPGYVYVSSKTLSLNAYRQQLNSTDGEFCIALSSTVAHVDGMVNFDNYNVSVNGTLYSWDYVVQRNYSTIFTPMTMGGLGLGDLPGLTADGQLTIIIICIVVAVILLVGGVILVVCCTRKQQYSKVQ